MEHDPKLVEQAFAQALMFAPGPEREAFLAKACAGSVELRREVEALLAAHERSGRFLDGGATLKVEPSSAAGEGGVEGTSVMGAASHAAVFLAEQGRGVTLEKFLADLPEELRREVRERILAAQAKREALRKGFSAEAGEWPQIPGFTLRRVLGQGGLGTAFEAWDEKLKRAVALKVLRPRADSMQRARILEEARHAAAVRDTAIVTIYSVLDESDPPAIVMELVNGFPLDQFCQNLTWEQKARILQEVARALAVAHKQGLIHRDLKPDNILIGPDMKPKVLDFGLAIAFEDVSGGLGYFEGSPLYASPEQAAGKALTAASDVFSFGSVMFKVLTGRPPFPGETVGEVLHSLATTRPPFLRDVAVGTPEDLQAICLACLSWKPEDRPSAAKIVVELGRYLAGEPVHLKPQMYDDILRQRISAHTTEAESWERQSMISRDERDSLQVVHRRILADEDHWIIDARRLTYVQTALSAGVWLMVVAAGLIVWLREEIGAPWNWVAPVTGTLALLGFGWQADRRREELAAASFLAAAALSVLPSALTCLKQLGMLTSTGEVEQLFPDGNPFTNLQVLSACLIAWGISTLGLARLKLTGFAWTTAVLGTATYLAVLLQFDWMAKDPQIKALWCLPLATLEPVALAFERMGRVRWTTPFHLISLVALVVALDVMAGNGPTLEMLGLGAQVKGYFDADRLEYFSYALNGVLFLALMLATERARSLDLRRAAKMLEILGISHTLGALFANALEHKGNPYVGIDVALYLGVALTFLAVAPQRSRWRLLMGGLAGLAFGSFLLLTLVFNEDEEKQMRQVFVLALGLAGLALAVGTYLYLRRAARPRRR